MLEPTNELFAQIRWIQADVADLKADVRESAWTGAEQMERILRRLELIDQPH